MRPSVALLAGVLIVAAADADLRATQSIGSRLAGESSPPPQGRLIRGRDGDTIVLEKDERVRVIHRRSAVVRATFNAAEGWLVLVLDFAAEPGAAPDGRADWTYNFNNVTGDWPLGERWEGEAIVEDYSVAGLGSQRGVGLRTAQGYVQLIGPPDEGLFRDPAVVAVLSYRGAGRGGAGSLTFDEAEQRAVADAKNNRERNLQLGGGSMSTFTSYGPSGGAVTSTLTAGVGLVGPGQTTPARVGSRIVSPKKIYDVPPVPPEAARQAGVRGVVVLEVTVGADGAVTEARVLRSLPMLDEAAIAAVRQWRYDPTLLNGQPVPIVITVPVNFQ